MIAFRNVDQLAQDVKNWLPMLPRDVALVVGVPRSGMLPATLVSLYLNCPLTDFPSFLAGREPAAGDRLSKSPRRFANGGRTLIIDDSVASGAALERAKSAVREAPTLGEVEFAAVYVDPTASTLPDHWYTRLSQPRCFEWNVMHHADVLAVSCIDIDGVLCVDPTVEENDDGARYAEFLRLARPLMVPTEPVHALVTSRLERYRRETERWLREHGVRYEHLFMLDVVSAKERQRLGSHAEFKARVYRDLGAELFIESDPVQARQIARKAAGAVLSFQEMRLITPSALQRMKTVPIQQRRLRRRIARKVNTARRIGLVNTAVRVQAGLRRATGRFKQDCSS